MDTLILLLKTVQLRPYVFIFLAVFLFFATNLIGWRRGGLQAIPPTTPIQVSRVNTVVSCLMPKNSTRVGCSAPRHCHFISRSKAIYRQSLHNTLISQDFRAFMDIARPWNNLCAERSNTEELSVEERETKEVANAKSSSLDSR